MVIQSVPQDYTLIQIHNLSYVFTSATSLVLCEKHGNLQLISYLVYNVVPCMGKLAESHSVLGHPFINKLNLLLHFLY